MVPKGEVYSRSERSGYLGRDGRTARRKSWWAPECCVVIDDTWVEKEKISRKKPKKVCNGRRAPLWLEVFGP